MGKDIDLSTKTDVSYENIFLDYTADKIAFIDQEYTYLSVNQAYLDTFQKSKDEIVGKKIWELLGAEGFQKLKKYLDKGLLGETVFYDEWFELPDGRHFLKVSYKPYYIDANIKGVVATVTDITQMKLLKIENKKQYHLLLEKSKMAKLGSLIAFIAHQMRQPLNSLSTSFMKMERLLDEKEYEQLPKMLEVNEQVIIHLAKTLDSVSEYYDISSEVKEVKIKYLIESTLLLLKSAMMEKDLYVELVCDEDLSIETIKSEFIHILTVLLTNACEATQDSVVVQGTLHVREKKVTIKTSQNEDHVYIRVYDMGCGVDEKLLPFLFQPGSTTKQAVGHGYGLYFAKQIVESSLHGTIGYFRDEKEHYFQIALQKKVY
jgi:PAS domain S-box-containing protein